MIVYWSIPVKEFVEGEFFVSIPTNNVQQCLVQTLFSRLFHHHCEPWSRLHDNKLRPINATEFQSSLRLFVLTPVTQEIMKWLCQLWR